MTRFSGMTIELHTLPVTSRLQCENDTLLLLAQWHRHSAVTVRQQKWQMSRWLWENFILHY